MTKIHRTYSQPAESKDGFDCLLKSSTTKEGIRIEGHDYQDVVGFHDRDTGRWYSVLKCERCGYPSVTWTDSDAPEMMAGHLYNQEVGGKP